MSENQNIPQGNQNALKEKTGAKVEEFIIENANINGINPNPTESGHAPEWDKGIQESEEYKSDAANDNETQDQ